MRRTISYITALALAMLSSCGKPPAVDTEPLMELEWFMAYDTVKDELGKEKLISERESNDDISQKMLDYSGVQLYENLCDLTLCFTDSGLIGFNYHDTERTHTYRYWLGIIEEKYGIPDEQGSGIASWYDDPVGKDTAVYLFNLQDEVQISFYATADSPDHSYKKQKTRKLPTPELRSPIVPVEDVTTSMKETTTVTEFTETVTAITSWLREYNNNDYTNTEQTEDTETDTQTQPVTTTSETVTNITTTAKPDRTNDYTLGGLDFYISPENGRSTMSGYVQLDEYRTKEAGQPWEIIMEYSGVPYLGNSCDAVLCFTSRGLVGISYFDSRKDSYNYWMDEMTDIYGKPDEVQYNYAVWTESPVGVGTTIYVFAAEDGVQISFFADDSGSEIS